MRYDAVLVSNTVVYCARAVLGTSVAKNLKSNLNRCDVMKKCQCIVCGFIYDEAEGLEEEGIAPGTAWDDIPEDWVCPECGVGKADFEMIEID